MMLIEEGILKILEWLPCLDGVILAELDINTSNAIASKVVVNSYRFSSLEPTARTRLGD
jgi:hypothetical protein